MNSRENIHFLVKSHLQVESLFSWLPNESPLLNAVLKSIKGYQRSDLIDQLTDDLAARVLPLVNDFGQKGYLIPIPPTRPDRQDHAYFIADRLSQHFGWPVVTPLRKSSLIQQKSQDRRSRMRVLIENSEKFSTTKPVILVDDIVTTGSTALAAAKALSKHGPLRVWSLAYRRPIAAISTECYKSSRFLNFRGFLDSAVVDHFIRRFSSRKSF